MSTWIRIKPRSDLEEYTNRWHLQGEPPAGGPARGIVAAACGSTITDPDKVDTWSATNAPASARRCPPCDALYRAELRQL